MTNYNSAKLVIVVSTLVLLFVSLPLQGHAGVVQQPQVTGLLKIFEIRYTGLLVCTPTGNPPSTGGGVIPGVVGAILNGTCNGGGGNISRVATNSTGFANGIITLLDGILFDPSTEGVPCFLTLQLPLIGTTCQVFPPTGTLRSVLKLVDLVLNLTGGLVAIVTAGPWEHVP